MVGCSGESGCFLLVGVDRTEGGFVVGGDAAAAARALVVRVVGAGGGADAGAEGVTAGAGGAGATSADSPRIGVRPEGRCWWQGYRTGSLAPSLTRRCDQHHQLLPPSTLHPSYPLRLDGKVDQRVLEACALDVQSCCCCFAAALEGAVRCCRCCCLELTNQ